ncbi:MAG TPA: transposase, partial [Bryobacteraceae bacterium]|nr:transposase [Bryobacteraceae bacterium]
MQDSLPAGGLRLYREGVEPSGSLRKVSGYISILLSRTSPVARVVYAKPPFGGPEAVLAYLSRYTHRVPISI